MKLEIKNVMGEVYIYVYNCKIGYLFNKNSVSIVFRQEITNSYSIAIDSKMHLDNLKSLSELF